MHEFCGNLQHSCSFFCRKQLAYKIMMNSVYGFCGATRGMLPCVEIAAAVTSVGRNMIDHSKRMVEDAYAGSEVVYGVRRAIAMSRTRHGTTKVMVEQSQSKGKSSEPK